MLNATPGGAEDAEALNSKTAKASGGSGGQRGYVGLMNCVFAAQKAVSYSKRTTADSRKFPSTS